MNQPPEAPPLPPEQQRRLEQLYQLLVEAAERRPTHQDNQQPASA